MTVTYVACIYLCRCVVCYAAVINASVLQYIRQCTCW